MGEGRGGLQPVRLQKTAAEVWAFNTVILSKRFQNINSQPQTLPTENPLLTKKKRDSQPKRGRIHCNELSSHHSRRCYPQKPGLGDIYRQVNVSAGCKTGLIYFHGIVAYERYFYRLCSHGITSKWYSFTEL